MSPQMDQALVQDFPEGPRGNQLLGLPFRPCPDEVTAEPHWPLPSGACCPVVGILPCSIPGVQWRGLRGQAGKAWPRGCQFLRVFKRG